jgi:hypothetical protein
MLTNIPLLLLWKEFNSSEQDNQNFAQLLTQVSRKEQMLNFAEMVIVFTAGYSRLIGP